MGKTKLKPKEVGQRLSQVVIFRASTAEAAAIDRLVRKTGRNRSEVLRNLVSKIRG